MAPYYFNKGNPLKIGKIQSKYRIERPLSRGHGRENYLVEGVVGDIRNKEYHARVHFFEQADLGELSLDDLIDKMDRTVTQLDVLNAPQIVPIVDFGAQPEDEEEGRLMSCTVRSHLKATSLAEIIHLNCSNKALTGKRIEPDKIKRIFTGLCEALLPLHTAGLACGNLKPQNIFIDENDTLSIADMDVDGLLGRLTGRWCNREAPADQLWLAPEQLGEVPFPGSPQSDIWSIGLLMFLCMGESYAFAGDTLAQMVHNMVSSRVHHKSLAYLPISLDEIINGCLKYEPDERFPDIDTLMNAISAAEFTKNCSADHPNPYWALHCEYPDCGLGFSKPGMDEDYELHDGWIGCPSVEGPLPVEGYGQYKVKLWPKQHPQYPKLTSTGVQLSVRLHSPDDSDLAKTPLRVKLLPAPEFDFQDYRIEVERNALQAKKPVRFPLLVKRSKVMIENIKVLVNGQEELAICDPTAYGRVFESRPEPYSLEVTFNPEILYNFEAEHKSDAYDEPVFDIIFVLSLKNRHKPHQLDAETLNHPLQIVTVSRPGLGIKGLDQEDNLRIVAYKDPRLPDQKDQIYLFNRGGGNLRVTGAVVEFLEKRDDVTDQGPVLVFEHIKTPKDISKSHNTLSYTVFPQNISGSACQLKMIFSLEAQYRNTSYNFTETRHCIIETRALQEGGILAVDFGTTNTMCAVLEASQDDTPEILKLEEECSPGDNSIPSIIEYGLDGRVTDFGYQALMRLKKGYNGIFQSFKRHIANPDVFFTIFPKQGGGVLKQMHGDRLCYDYIHNLYQKIQPLLGRRFQSLIFTHPTLFSTRKRRAYEAILAECGFDNYTLLDEALAGAYEFIKENTGKRDDYGLLVYDFGGGTIDIAYVHVPRNDFPRVLGAGGMPNFGGDDVTSAIEKIVITTLKTDGHEIILPESDKYNFLSDHERRQVRSCRSAFWGLIENIKKEKGKLFESETATLLLPQPPFLVWRSGRAEKLAIKSWQVSRQAVYAEIYQHIEQSVEIAYKLLRDNTSEQKESLENQILLSGQSSRIPLVKEVFLAFQRGERPFWNEEKKQLSFRSPKDDINKMNFESIKHSKEPKACVAKGAAHYKQFIDMNLHTSIPTGLGTNSKTITRIGRPHWANFFQDNVKFNEWIPAGCHLIPENGDSSPPIEAVKQREPAAVAERDFYFQFSRSSNGEFQLNPPIDVYEHLSSGDGFSPIERELAGRYTLNKPNGCDNNVQGRLRMEMLEGYRLRLKANIGGQWLELQEC